MGRVHYYGAQALPLIAGKVVCLNCGKVKRIGADERGRRAKCSPTRVLVHLDDGATGQRSIASGKVRQRSLGHAGYDTVKRALDRRDRMLAGAISHSGNRLSGACQAIKAAMSQFCEDVDALRRRMIRTRAILDGAPLTEQEVRIALMFGVRFPDGVGLA